MKLKQVVKPILTIIIKVFGLLPLKKNKILFSAFSARSYSDNPKYIAEELLKEGVNVDCVFVLDHDLTGTVPSGIRIVKYNTLKYLYELATSKFWVDNTRKQDFIVKRKDQIYIQTWHGALPFKKIEKDISVLLTDKYIRTAKNDSEMINYLLTNSKFGEKILRQSFWYDGQILITGSPRLDVLFKDNLELKKTIQTKVHLDPKIKYALYAPTFRDNGKTDVYNIDFRRVTNVLSSKFGGDWKVIMKLHPNIREDDVIADKNVVNASMYPDIMDLFFVSEILITDYSSTMFDFSLTQKPVFLYTPDSEEYLNMRSSYFDLNHLPFSIGKDLKELENNILNFNSSTYVDNLQKFFKDLRLVEDGKASERVAKLIIDNIDD